MKLLFMENFPASVIFFILGPIFTPTLSTKTHLTLVLSSVLETKFHTHMK
jgi:hypothetical protein